MTVLSKALGIWGEQRACQYLQEQGYQILDINFRNRMGEIDIVAKDAQGTVCFIEVKTRQNLQCGQPYEAVDHIKTRKISRLALSYLKFKFGTVDVFARFDVVSIYKEESGKARVEHITNAFDLSPRLN